VDLGDLAPTKVHISGLDNLTTSDVRSFAGAHFIKAEPLRIEWIDDTSANIIYDLPEHASEAIANFVDMSTSGAGITSLTQLQKAKDFANHPGSKLFVRQAFISDVKQPHAREASRFYLLNPDKDPRERNPQYDSRRGRRGNDRRGDGDRRQRREKDADKETPFDVNMYDDDAASLAARKPVRPSRQRSRSSHMSEERIKRRISRSPPRRRGGDLFLERLGTGSTGRLRDRSASPSRLRDGDGRLGFDEGESRGRRMRERSRTPPERSIKLSSRANAGKELLAPPGATKTKELFPGRISPAIEENSDKELFPRKPSTGNHRRSAAFDAADGSGDLFAHRLTGSSPGSKPRSLADRVTGGAVSDRARGGGDDSDVKGFNIRGSARQVDVGFTIRGGAGSTAPEQRSKELFPNKTGGNNGKELFGSKANGRSVLRA